MFQVVVVVCGRTARRLYWLMAASFLLISITYIDINISDVEYNGWIHIFMEDRKKPPGALHALAHHAESLAVDVLLSPSNTTRRGVGRV